MGFATDSLFASVAAHSLFLDDARSLVPEKCLNFICGCLVVIESAEVDP